MANIYVGFHDQRSCNRILKPPGGGTSNIFGTDSVPDVVPQNSPRKENKHCSGNIQQILQTETVTTVTTKQEKSSTTNGDVTMEEKTCHVESNGDVSRENNFHEVALVPQEEALVSQEVTEQQNGNSTPDVIEVTSKVEQIRIEEKSSKSEVSETDGSGNTNVISSSANSEGSVERSSSCKKGTVIQDFLKDDDIEQKKRVKGQAQRVPPGGYSSGLW